jgi:hypothetical protein
MSAATISIGQLMERNVSSIFGERDPGPEWGRAPGANGARTAG